MITNVPRPGGRLGGRRQPPLPARPTAAAVPEPVVPVEPLNVEVLHRILARLRERC